MTTIGESISRVRGILKGTNEDSFLTDRFVYSIISKYAKLVLRKQQVINQLMKHEDLFQVLPFVDLIDVDTIEADCAGFSTNCTIKRTEQKIPKVFSSSRGPLIRKVYSIDSSSDFVQVSPASYIALSLSTNFKYNKTRYFWFRNGYLYFPNVQLEAVMVEALWEDTLDNFCTAENNDCLPMQEQILPIPDYLFAEVEQQAEQELTFTLKITTDGADNSQNLLR